MVIGGGAFAESHKNPQGDKNNNFAANESPPRLELLVHEHMLDDLMPLEEVKFRGGGLSGAGRAVSRGGGALGRSAGDAGRAAKGATDAGKAAKGATDAGKAAKGATDAGKAGTEAGTAVKDLPKGAAPDTRKPETSVPSVDGRNKPETSVPSIDGRKQADAQKPAAPAKEVSKPNVNQTRPTDSTAPPAHCSFVRSYFDPTCIGWWVYGMGSGSSKAKAAPAADCNKVDPKDKARQKQCQIEKEFPLP